MEPHTDRRAEVQVNLGSLEPGSDGVAPVTRPKNTWSVVVLYEQSEARERAVRFCGELVDRFWATSDFAVTWWPFESLGQREAGREASEKAVAADLIVFAGNLDGELPLPVRRWLEAWVAQRGEREGKLVDVIQAVAGSRPSAAERNPYLRHVAHRAGMDYLTEIPTDLSRCLPDCLGSYSERAGQVTSLLDAILHQHPRPPSLR